MLKLENSIYSILENIIFFYFLFMNKLKHHFLWWLVFLGTITFWYIWYSAYTSLSIQNDWAVITKDIWNNVITTINDIWNKTDWIYSSWWNIGIWTSDITSKLSIKTNSSGVIWWWLSLKWNNDIAYWENNLDSSNNFQIYWFNWTAWTYNLHINRNNWNVWIWTTSPTAKLDVNWVIKSSWNPHIFWSLTKSDWITWIANSFSTVTSRWWMTWSWDRINISVEWVYIINLNTISSLTTWRVDAYIYINWIERCRMLTEDNWTWYHQKNCSITYYLNAWDYVQFRNDNWWNNTYTTFTPRRTASVSLIN